MNGTDPVRDQLGASLDRRFNHDLLIESDDQSAAMQRWPSIARFLLHPDLGAKFLSHDRASARQKTELAFVGSAAILFMLWALLSSGLHIWFDTPAEKQGAVSSGALTEVCAVVGLLLALLASRYGPLRRRWLKNRFVAEVFRQWQFRHLLDGEAIDRGLAAPDLHTATREREFATLLQNLSGTVGQKMDELSESRRDPLGRIRAPRLPSDAKARAELLEAYRTLRLDHQRQFGIYKLSPDDKTFLGLPLKALVWATGHLAGLTLILALGVSIARIVTPLAWAPLAAIALAIVGVAVRSWRDGLALSAEGERYQEMVHRLELITARWDAAESDEKRFQLAEEIEQTALEELRSFIRAHESAQFLL